MATHIGLIGGGNISETHARAARAITDVQIAAVFGTNRENVNRLCREYGGTPYTDFEKFLAHRPMEVVAIGSPSGLHAEQGMATDTPSFTPALRASATPRRTGHGSREARPSRVERKAAGHQPA